MVLTLQLPAAHLLTRRAVAAGAALATTRMSAALAQGLAATFTQQQLGARHALAGLSAPALLFRLLQARTAGTLMAAGNAAMQATREHEAAGVATRGHILSARQLTRRFPTRTCPLLASWAVAAASRVTHLLAAMMAAGQWTPTYLVA